MTTSHNGNASPVSDGTAGEGEHLVTQRPSFLILALLLWPFLLHADEVDDYIKHRMKKEHLPGLSLAVLKDGNVVKLKGYGYSDLELRVPASPETAYQVGSITKQFTAAAILLLVQEGRINLDDRITIRTRLQAKSHP